jgi:hypothetical protein
MRISQRAAAATAAALAGVLLTALPAEAHTTLTGAVPGKGSTVASPAQVVLTFTDPVRFPQVAVLDAGHGHHEAGRSRAVGNRVTQQIAGVLAPGTYTVGWRVVADDGHPVAGDYTFTVKGPASTGPTPSTSAPTADPATRPATPPAAQPAERTSGSGWRWVGLAVLVAAAAAGGFALVRRRR